MKEELKTKEQLMNELAEMRQRIAEWEASEVRHKRAEEVLRGSEEHFRSMLESIDLGMNLVDCDYNIVMVNAAQGRHFSKPPHEMIGKKCYREFEKRDAVCPHCPGVEAIATGQPAEVETHGVRDDGSRFDVRLRAFPTFGQDGTVRGFVEIGQDITERKRAEEKIEHLNLVLRAIRNVNQLITRERDRDRLLQDACETLIETRGYHSAWIALLDESGGPVTTAEAGLGEDFLPLVEQLKDGALPDCGWRALKQSGVVVTEEPASTCADCPLSSMYGGMGAVTIGLEYGGKVYGLLSVSIPRDLAADEEEQGLFEEVAGDIAFALCSIELEEEAQTRAEELAVLNEMGRALTAMLDVDAVAENIYHHASRLIDTTNFYVALYDPELDEVSFPLYAEGEQIRVAGRRRAGQGMTEYVIRTREPLLIEENVTARLEELGIERIGTDAQSWLGVPMTIGDQVLGVIAVQSYTTPWLYDERDRDLLSAIANQAAIAIKNAWLFEETRSRAERLAVVNHIAKAASATLHLDDLMETVYREITPIFQGDAFFIALYDEETDELDFRFLVDEGGRQPPERIPLSGLSSLVVTEKKPLVIRDLEQERGRLPAPVLVGGDKLSTSWLGVPLMVGAQVIGVINVQSYRPHAWGEEDELLLLTIADQVAVALENARLFEDTERRLAQLTALQETTQAVASTLELDKLLNLITQQATALFQGSGGIINLVDWEKKEEEVVVASGSVASAVGLRSTLEGSLSGWAILHNQPVISNQLQNDDRVDVRVRSGMVPGQNAAIAPLTVKDQVMGTLVVMDKEGGFDQANLDVLVAFANQAATAIENARLFEETQARAEELAILNEMGRVLTTMLDVDAVIESLYQHASRLIDTAHFYVALYDAEQDMVSFPLYIEEGQAIQQEPFRAGKGLSGYVIRTREPLLMEENVAARVEELGIEAIRLESLSWLGVPMTVGGGVIGMISAHSHTTPRLYNERHRDLLSAIANQAAIAIQNARLFEQTEAALEALRVSEERFALAVQGANDGIWDWDFVNDVLYWSPRFKELLGYADDELDIDFDTFDSLLHPDDRKHTNAAIETHLKDQGLYDVEQRLRTKSGEYRWFRARGQTLWDEDGNPIRGVGFSTDITERKRAEEALKRRMEQLAALSQTSQAVTASLELDQVLAEIVSLASEVVASDYTTVILMDEAGKIGQSAENLPGVPAIEYRVREKGLTNWIVRSRQAVVIDEIGEDGAISPDLGEGAPRFVTRSIVEAGIKSCAGLPLMAKGRLLGVLHLHCVRPRALDGQLPLLTTFANQVAIAIENARLFEQTKAALEALRVSEERFALAVRGSNDGIWDWDIKNDTLYWSPRLKELLGYADDELEVDFDTFESILHPDDKERTGPAIEAHLKDRGLYNVEQRLRTKSGEYRWFNARGQALWDEDGNAIRMIGSSTDITERKAAEKALKEYSERLEEMVEERTQELRDTQEALIRQEKLAVLGQLAGGVGHELRNPLGAISNAAYFLNMVLEEPEPDVKETLDILEKEVKTSERIISSLLDFARAKPPTRRRVDINEVVQEALSRATVPGNVEVVSQLDEALPIILADPGQLVQAFGNIILNAVQAMSEGGHLVVKSEVPSPEWMAVSFADTGVGIPKENLGKLFEPLFTTKAKGIGLGLAVTKTLVEGHEGTIEVESQVGKGTTVRVKLPISVG